jgi:uncharacterized membrane protein YbhN (UPF0104 family)
MKIRTIVGFVMLGAMLLMFYVFRHDFVLAGVLLKSQITPGLAAGIIFLPLCHFGSEPLRWRMILKTRWPNLTLTHIYHTVTATSVLSYGIPMHFGMPMRLVMAKKILMIDYAAASALLVMDSFFLYGVWFLAGALGMAIMLPHWGLGLSTAIALVLLAGCIGLVFVARHDWQLGHRYPQIFSIVRRFSLGLQMLSQKAAIANTILLVVDIFIYGIRHTLILFSLGVDCSLMQVTLIVSISVFTGFASFMPLGLGGYDLSLIYLLTMIGIPREAAVAVPIINRITMVSAVALLGGISAGRLGLTWHKIRVMEKEEAQL